MAIAKALLVLIVLVSGCRAPSPPAAVAEAEEACRDCVADLAGQLEEFVGADGGRGIRFADSTPPGVVERSRTECEPLIGKVLRQPGPLVDRSIDAGERASDEQVWEFVAENAAGFDGAVAVVRAGDTLLRQGFGVVAPGQTAPITVCTAFDIGSVAKVFTAASVFALVAQRRLSLDDRLGDLLAEVPGDKAAITLEQLLAHRSGLGEYHDTQGDFEVMGRGEALAEILGRRLLFDPGSDYAYSNSGYTMLAAVVEDVTGEPFADAVRTLVLDPLGLSTTGFYGDERWDTVAEGRGGKDFQDNNPATWPPPTWAVLGAGGMVSTAADLSDWVVAFNSGKLLSDELVGRFRKVVLAPVTFTVDSTTAYAYNGANEFGFTAAVLDVPSEQTHAVVLSANSGPSNDAATDLLFGVTERLLGGAPQPRD